MAKKMKLPQQWQWPLCKQPKTLSFRAGDEIFKAINSVSFDPSDDIAIPETWFTSSSDTASISSDSEECFGEESLEIIIRGVQSERLFFEPDNTSSIIGKEESKTCEIIPFKESVVMAMDSEDPYIDFKKSMEEMIEINGLKDWECLEELLLWYLKMNHKKHHGFIIEAFFDLLIGFASSSFCDFGSSFTCESEGD